MSIDQIAPPEGTVRAETDGDVATLVLDRSAKLNALTPEMLDALEAALRAVAAGDARVVVVRGAGPKAFCVGADINRFASLSSVEMWREWTARGHRVFDLLASLRQPTVAVVHGVAAGGGLELALACDFRIVTTDARLSLPEVGLGTVPGWGGTERLTELVGRARAKQIVLARQQVDGPTAAAWGLATECPAPDAAEEAVTDLVDRLSGGSPIAVQIAKQLIDAAAEGAPSRVLEALGGGLASATEDLIEGMRAFHERRAPHFRGL
ncbi:enoyl-CoA hydratase/isomerase family protein [Streptomyces sp. NBC_00286]|uniref:enoyl-CoA hydratase/isomerase family protein n=1 Tax=Streptomyces sp. NBC_00286 TaxID=2975701 RepID=UPI002E2A0821|nr:enoyl-CoA hydratase/isomerase family protein [Streptomyces sp. NBC_00286]